MRAQGLDPKQFQSSEAGKCTGKLPELRLMLPVEPGCHGSPPGEVAQEKAAAAAGKEGGDPANDSDLSTSIPAAPPLTVPIVTHNKPNNSEGLCALQTNH